MVHELYNTEWIEELGAGIVIEDFSRDIAAAIRRLLEPGNYAKYREHAAATHNVAVYEIADMLSGILGELGGWRPGPSYDFAAPSRIGNALPA
jgi:UDP-N-acetylglucosamine:LPS N-acetylglucosamine transferase